MVEHFICFLDRTDVMIRKDIYASYSDNIISNVMHLIKLRIKYCMIILCKQQCTKQILTSSSLFLFQCWERSGAIVTCITCIGQCNIDVERNSLEPYWCFDTFTVLFIIENMPPVNLQ